MKNIGDNPLKNVPRSTRRVNLKGELTTFLIERKERHSVPTNSKLIRKVHIQELKEAIGQTYRFSMSDVDYCVGALGLENANTAAIIAQGLGIGLYDLVDRVTDIAVDFGLPISEAFNRYTVSPNNFGPKDYSGPEVTFSSLPLSDKNELDKWLGSRISNKGSLAGLVEYHINQNF